jgi:hypothetical protein
MEDVHVVTAHGISLQHETLVHVVSLMSVSPNPVRIWHKLLTRFSVP